MKKYILPLILLVLLVFLAYQNSLDRSRISELEGELVRLEEELQVKNQELDIMEKQFQASKKLAEIMTAKAYEAGYDPSK